MTFTAPDRIEPTDIFVGHTNRKIGDAVAVEVAAGGTAARADCFAASMQAFGIALRHQHLRRTRPAADARVSGSPPSGPAPETPILAGAARATARSVTSRV